MLGRKKYEIGYKKYENHANDYLKNPERADRLLKAAQQKAFRRKSSLSEIWSNLILLFDLIRSWRKGEYKKISAKTLVTVIAAIIYFVSPIDIVPDFLVGIGIIDDVAVLSFVLKQLSAELLDYSHWKEETNKIIDSPDGPVTK
ncbi:YkvA family protein [Mesobacillus zeae]|uniref:DUF1232 domain-containing protein n=1 Tax=Mesobacillus zeae TaxID=1917180 RepID=A0A398BCH7_9BACI|nr:YkvA family protein [Mesobacillus zeae]RID87775.1 DUF1232 domain-containing protein [Mesobacillus zeae]